MDPIVNYLEETEKKLMSEMSELFNKMRVQRDTMSLQGIEDMYTIKPVDSVLYEPCVRIPCTNQYVKSQYPSTLYYCSQYKLPTDETIVFVKELINNGSQHNPGSTYSCFALTNYGRFIRTNPISENRMFGGYSYYSYSNDMKNIQNVPTPTSVLPIIKLEPLAYKSPSWFLKSFIAHDTLYPDVYTNTVTSDINRQNSLTNSLQELNKEFYLFAGKWQPHMTEHAMVDLDTMRQTIIENSSSIQELSVKNKALETENALLHIELKELREQKAALEKEKATLQSLEKYKEAVIDFMEEHYDGDEPYDISDDDQLTIDWFKEWHSDKVFMDRCVYDDVMESKEELNEYRIYKKIKAEMVSTGMDNSTVARNVRSIKKGNESIARDVSSIQEVNTTIAKNVRIIRKGLE